MNVRLAAASLSLLVLAGCSGQAAPTAQPHPPSPTRSTHWEIPDDWAATEGSGSTDSADTYVDDSVTIECDDIDFESYAFTSYRDAWEIESDDCSTTIDRPLTAEERKIGRSAFGRDYDEHDVAAIYDTCAEAEFTNYNDPDDEPGEREINELAGALILCPDHPGVKRAAKQVAAWRKLWRLEKAGRSFTDGTYRVGKDIKPGTYVTRNVDGCYWERQNRSGRTIDNYFTNGAKRVEVTIRSSDYGFFARDCGRWAPR